jgi:acetyltransferase-like isoleucine patch superfamily enzyme
MIRKILLKLKHIKTLFWCKLKKNVRLGKRVFFKGAPLLEVCKGSVLTLGNGVVLNSSNKGYHINMHSPCKVLMDRPGASVMIGEHSRIHGTCIHAYSRIEIGKRCLVAANTQIFDGNGHDLSMDDPANRIHTTGTSKDILIGDDVWIGANTIILPGTIIGKGSAVIAGSVVRGEWPEKCLIGGNPAKLLKEYL